MEHYYVLKHLNFQGNLLLPIGLDLFDINHHNRLNKIIFDNHYESKLFNY